MTATRTRFINDCLLTETEAAQTLGVKPSTLRAWRSTGKPGQPKFVRVNSRAIRYRASDLAAYIDGLVEGGEAA